MHLHHMASGASIGAGIVHMKIHLIPISKVNYIANFFVSYCSTFIFEGKMAFVRCNRAFHAHIQALCMTMIYCKLG